MDSLVVFFQELDLRAWILFQMLPKTHRVHAVYVLVKSDVPEVLRSVASSLPWMFTLEKISLPFRGISKLWRSRWMVLPSVVERQKNRTSAIAILAPFSAVKEAFCLNPSCCLGSQMEQNNNDKCSFASNSYGNLSIW